MTVLEVNEERTGRVWTVPTGGSAGLVLIMDTGAAQSKEVEQTVAKEASRIHRIHVISSSSTDADSDQTESPLKQIFVSMSACPILTVLRLKNVKLSDASKLITFTKAIQECRTLQHLSAEDCSLGDQGCFELCKVLTGCPTISTLCLEGNGLTEQAAAALGALIERQDLARSMSWWKRSLRGRKVQPDSLLGLNRLTLNRNPQIGDSGLKHIAGALYDDFWMRAVDMRACGVSEAGAEEVLLLLKVNRGLEAFDLRENPEVPLHLLCAVVQRITKNLGPLAHQPIWIDNEPFVEEKDTPATSDQSIPSVRFLTYKPSEECFSLKSNSNESILEKSKQPVRKTKSSMSASSKKASLNATDEKTRINIQSLKNRASSAAPTQKIIQHGNKDIKFTQSSGITRWKNSRQTLLKI